MPFTPPLQTKHGSISGSSLTLTFPNPVVSGDLIIVATSTGGPGTPTGVAISDTLGNTYTQIFAQADLSGSDTELYYCNSIAGGTNAVTLTKTSQPQWNAIIAEYNINATLDQVTHGSSGTYALTTTKPTELVIAVCSSGLEPATWTCPGFTNEAQEDAAPVLPVSLVLFDMDVTSTGTYTAVFSSSPAFSASGGIASFYAATPLTVPGKIIVTTPVPPAPVIAADLHGLAMAYLTSKSGNKPILQCAFTNDLQNFQSWLFFTMWDWGADTGPPPPDLSIASGIGGMWLTWDFVEICCGRGYLSVTGKANLGSPATPSANQQMYVGIIQWNSVQVP